MSPRPTLLAVLSLCLLQTAPAWSQTEQRFRVELVIFAHEPGARAATEDFLAEPDGPSTGRLEEIELAFTERPDWLAILAEGRPDTDEPQATRSDSLETVALPPFRQLLDPAAAELDALLRRLRAQSSYRPLMHLVWDQVALPDAEPPVVDVGASLLASPEIRGSATLSRSRFLHLRLDLEFLPADGVTPRVLATGDGLGEVRLLTPRYRLQESRRMRSGEVHYFDHPAFGVIAKVTPVSPSRAEP
jgi:hypothetical protein